MAGSGGAAALDAARGRSAPRPSAPGLRRGGVLGSHSVLEIPLPSFAVPFRRAEDTATVAAVPSIGRADRVAPEADLTRALYERYSAQIFRYCLHQLGSREEAEDAVQSTFLNAFRGIKRGIVPELESA